jgi:hypothetical protein
MQNNQNLYSTKMSFKFFEPIVPAKPPIGHKMGWCTTRFTKQTKCPNCHRLMWELHQPFKDDNYSVCAFCFNTVEKK